MSRLELNDSDRLKIGLKQSLRALHENLAKTVYIAKDADAALTEELVELSKARQVPVVFAESMKELGKACQIDVGAATAVVLK